MMVWLKYATAARVAMIACAALGSASAQAQTQPANTRLSLKAASRMVQAAVETCARNNQKVAAAVVDADGQLKAFAAADGASKLAVSASIRKAATAAAFKDTTANLNARKAEPGLRLRIEGDPAFLSWPGGVPVLQGSEVIGGLGVGGATGAGGDEPCALAGLSSANGQ